LSILLANNPWQDHPALLIAHIAFLGARHPETGVDRKAGDCFGFSPSFTEWIFVVADRRRF
jgi:hypothetical protein